MTRIWHGALAALIAFALVGQTALTLSENRSVVNLLSYFTIQSNILILVAAVVVTLQPDREGNGWAILRLAGLVGITVTGIVYSTVLAGMTSFTGIEWWYDRIFHYAVPVGAVLGFFLFVPRTRFAKGDLVFVAWPVVWLAYTLIRGAVSHPRFLIEKGTYADVPYDFLDADTYGAGRVTVNALAVTLLIVGLAALYVRFSSRSEGDPL